jgi:hypothetical protein
VYVFYFLTLLLNFFKEQQQEEQEETAAGGIIEIRTSEISSQDLVPSGKKEYVKWKWRNSVSENNLTPRS